MKEIINDVVPGNVLIIISGIESENGTTPDFDCGLATESMFLGAHGLGLGARIYYNICFICYFSVPIC
jgi:hypothetical protein